MTRTMKLSESARNANGGWVWGVKTVAKVTLLKTLKVCNDTWSLSHKTGDIPSYLAPTGNTGAHCKICKNVLSAYMWVFIVDYKIKN